MTGKIFGETPLPQTQKVAADGRRIALDVTPAAVKSLTALGNEYVFFTPGLLSLGGFDRDPVAEFARIRNLDVGEFLLVIDADRVVLPDMPIVTFHSDSGDQTIDYRRRLYACRNDFWDKVREFIAQLSWYRKSEKFFGKCAWTTAQMPDFTNSTVFSGTNISVVVFVPQTTHGTVFLTNTTEDVYPRAEYTKTDPGALQMANILFTTED